MRDAQAGQACAEEVKEGNDVEKGTKLETLPEHEHEGDAHEGEDAEKDAKHLDGQHPEELQKGQVVKTAQAQEVSGAQHPD